MTARPAGSAGCLDRKVLQYEAFINDVLRRDLRAVLEQRDRLYEKMSHYLQLKNAIHSLQEAGPRREEAGPRREEAGPRREEAGPRRQEAGLRPLQADVDLGCSFFVQARVDDPSRILVLVGFGFFVEMSHQEALRFIDKKTNQLTLFTEQLTKDAAKIKAHIRMVLEGLRELQGLEDLPDVSRKSAAAAQL